MPLLMQLGIIQAIHEIDLNAKLFIPFFELVNLVFIGHLIDPVPVELFLVLKAKVTRPEDK